MISPADQKVIQIEVCNGGCQRHCSNCTRGVPLVRKPFWMGLPAFRRAVDSMAGYRGLLGIMGGEPTAHREFAAMVEYYAAHWGKDPDPPLARAPIADWGEWCQANISDVGTPTNRGLWSAVPPAFAHHWELIADTFGYQCLNTHQAGARHQVLWATRGELGIPDSRWRELRDNCRLQAEWSASINPLGAWFCEIAAALAIVYEDSTDPEVAEMVKTAWPVEPRWWRRRPADFGRQLGWCEFCGGCLNLPARVDAEGLQDVSPRHYELLRAVGARLDRVRVIDPGRLAAAAAARGGLWDQGADAYSIDKRGRYGPGDVLRRAIDALTVAVDCPEIARTLPANLKHFDRYCVVTASHDRHTQQVARDCGAMLVVDDSCFDGFAFNKARAANAGLQRLQPRGWLFLTDADCFLHPDFGAAAIRRLILNPGRLYYARRYDLAEGQTPDWQRGNFNHGRPCTNEAPWGYFQLFHARASALERIGGLRYPDVFGSAGSMDHWLKELWPADRRVLLPQTEPQRRGDAETVSPRLGVSAVNNPCYCFAVVHIPHGPLATRWNGTSGRKGWRYVAQSDLPNWRNWADNVTAPCKLRLIDVRAGRVLEERQWQTHPTYPAWTIHFRGDRLYEIAACDL